MLDFLNKIRLSADPERSCDLVVHKSYRTNWLPYAYSLLSCLQAVDWKIEYKPLLLSLLVFPKIGFIHFRVTDNILAMSRPITRLVEEFHIVEQFNE